MNKKSLCIGITAFFLLGLIACQTPDTPTPVNQRLFERVDPHLADGTSLLMNRKFREKTGIADFLARIWSLYGKPDAVHFEGFSYAFRHKESGLVFTAYCAGSGPAYGGNPEQEKQVLPLIRTFDRMLDSTGYADCEIEFATDFGNCRAGSKNGVLFETYEEE